MFLASRGTPTIARPHNNNMGSVHTPTVQKHRFENERVGNGFCSRLNQRHERKLTDDRDYGLFGLRSGRIRVRGKG